MINTRFLPELHYCRISMFLNMKCNTVPSFAPNNLFGAEKSARYYATEMSTGPLVDSPKLSDGANRPAYHKQNRPTHQPDPTRSTHEYVNS